MAGYSCHRSHDRLYSSELQSRDSHMFETLEFLGFSCQVACQVAWIHSLSDIVIVV